MPADAFLIFVLAIPFAASLATMAWRSPWRHAESLVAASAAFACLALLAPAYGRVSNGQTIRLKVDWLPDLGVGFILRLDGFSWIFACLVAGMGGLVALYARQYMSPSDPLRRFYATLLAFMGAMLGVVMSGDLIQLVFFWELTSVFSFLLIGYWSQKASAREGARMALTVTAAGGLCLLGGVLLIGRVVGSFDLDRVLVSGPQIREHALYVPTLVLVALGALTKSAQFPFHFWLPHAMAAPTPVSAYLHSATMVKAGVFLLIRLWPALGGSNEWLWIVGGAGLVTFILGAFLAMFQQDMKGLLAYSTISHLGLITLLTGLDTPMGQIAAIFHILNHATFKASLFMAVGVIDHETGTRDMRRLSGLRHAMPIMAALAIVAAAAMAGVPLLNGFLSKEMFFAETIEMHDYSAIDHALPYIVTVASAFSVVYSLRFIRDVFFGPPATDLPRAPHEPPLSMRLPAEALVVIVLVVGMAPALTIGPALAAAVLAVVGPNPPDYSLAVWHGLTPELGMSAAAMLIGVLAYAALHRWLLSVDAPPLVGRLSGKGAFEAALAGLERLAGLIERRLGTARLQPQLRVLVAMAALACAAPFLLRGAGAPGPLRAPVDLAFALVWTLGAACAFGAALLAKFHRLAALMMLGGAGLAVCLTFVWLAAPDLAATQLVVETVTTVLLLLGLRWLPRRIEGAGGETSAAARRWARGRDAAMAAVVGAGAGALAFVAMTRPPPPGPSRFFVENAYTHGGGANIVNVILVDFRGFDTFGEIAVLGAVALVVFALLRRFRPSSQSVEDAPRERPAAFADRSAAAPRAPGAPARTSGHELLLTLTFPLIAAVALYLLLRGHDLPGGGFAGGVVMAAAFVVQYMARDTEWVEARLRVAPVRWIAVGLILAGLVGVGAIVAGRPFLTTYFAYSELPVLGKVPTASAFLFDLGVFALVVGATALMLIALSHQSIRGRPRGLPRPARREA